MNWHRDCSRLDFKSNASTDSATGACIIAYRLQGNNTTNIFHCQIENLVIYLSNSLILTVNGGNVKKDPANTHKYVIKFSSSFVFEAYVTSFALNGVDSSFDKLQFNSSVSGDYASSDVAIEVSPLAQYCADYDKNTGVLTIVVWAGNFDKNASNFNTYKITFKK